MRPVKTSLLVVATIASPSARYQTAAELDAFYEALLTRTRALPGVSYATTTYSAPLFGTCFNTTVVPEGLEEKADDPIWVGTVIIRDDYFATNSIPLLEGKDFTAADRLGDPPPWSSSIRPWPSSFGRAAMRSESDFDTPEACEARPTPSILSSFRIHG